MSDNDRYEQVASLDGDHFDAFCATPSSGSGPGILLFQEIFGINDNMRGLAQRLADADDDNIFLAKLTWYLSR